MKIAKIVLLTLALLCTTRPIYALSLSWETVSTDPSGALLSPELLPTAYKIWKCNTPSASCTKSAATVLATVPAVSPQPARMTFSIDNQSSPQTYFVTAVNIVTESQESNSVKVTGPNKTITKLESP